MRRIFVVRGRVKSAIPFFVASDNGTDKGRLQ